ncbi:hypothetical protein BO94DRAFT_64956 [Aspergillus sclerotioniger CBS 115572]|uniref:AB hydrolase-1 domain-containing protein n=1 Tax=Aspergillus sclerotioniger CBS 115572 TaxID=1450535 RepID=A0A317WSL0_9EURO|nr:hypothetical protein BO94DRAFT_64956 [Aspergillus sclerotioniger CBS 115572]PWY88137.1 hypothetical protein BO94DRAFT_64956 [Aspergillus sclerotioniger CBS 115572]
MTDRTHVLEFAAEKRFHQRLVLPATADHGPLAISYADIGPKVKKNGKPTPTILLIQGMGGSRLWCYHKDHLANKLRVRMLAIDRPGIGGSTPIPAAKRVTIWLESVAAVLEHLSIPHVVPLSHSAGTIYLLNLLSQRRDLLWPKTPLAVLMGPWVEPKHSGIVSLKMAQMLPTGILNHYDKLMNLIVKALPSVNASASTFSAVVNRLSGARADTGRESKACLSEYGMNLEMVKVLDRLTMDYVCLEDTSGMNDEAVVCLKKAPGLWGACEDLPVYLQELVQAEEQYRQDHPGEKALRVKVHFAESDGMIGPKGQKYFEDCFTQADLREAIIFESVVEKGTEHDSIWLADTKVFANVIKIIQATISP